MFLTGTDRENIPAGVLEETDAAHKSLQEAGVILLVNETLALTEEVSDCGSDGLVFYGSPLVTKYAAWETAFNALGSAMQEHWRACPAFAQSDGDLRVDIMATHTPPLGIGDRELCGHEGGCEHLRASLEEAFKSKPNRVPRVNVFGHVHSDFGSFRRFGALFVNAASVTEWYTTKGRLPITIDVPLRNVSTRELNEVDKLHKIPV
jgi:Icc-related predicted phosphoesterase